MKIHRSICYVFILLALSAELEAQKNNLFFTTGFGALPVTGKLKNTFHPSVAFNSGIELQLKKGWYLQMEAGFNSLKYNQQQKDITSPYLFQNTSSSLFQAGINGGKNFAFKTSGSGLSVYAGSGYINIGEPRILLINDVAKQQVVRKGGISGRLGSRLCLKTKSNFFQTIYLDASYWAASIKIQQSRLQGLSFFIGSKMSF